MGKLFGKAIFTGDLEFDLGLNTKLFQWEYQVQDLTQLDKAPSWIKVSEFIPLPYIGIKYHWYNLKLYADVSSLAFSDAQSTSYQFGMAYRVVAGLYLSLNYMSEEFKVVEDQDTIDFQTDGYKFSFKYAF
jgi:predicted porin